MSVESLPVNRVLLGDCVEVMQTLPDKCVDLVFADPPYNLQLGGDLWRPNQTQVDAVNDDWDKFGSFAEYDAFTKAWLLEARRVLKDTGTLWVMGSYHNIYRIGAILQDLGFWILNDIAWVKVNPMPNFLGTRFCNAHETLLWAKKSEAQKHYTFHYKALKAGNDDRQMRSDWFLPLCTGRERETRDGKKAHPTQKPESLLHRVIASTSNPGDIVLDPFGGTGTTAAVAKRLGRQFITIEREEGYVGIAEKRVAGVTPALLDGGGVLIDAPRPKVPFVCLVENGTLPAGSVLRLKGASTQAVVNADGTVSANGVRASIHKVAAHVLGLPSCNGWTAWLFTNPLTGVEALVDVLRDKHSA